MQVIESATPVKMGVLKKLGGAKGGHKNWKDRFFVLADHVAYYDNQAAYEKNPDKPKGVVALNSYFVAKTEDSKNFEFTVHSYPKSLTCRASTAEELQEWIDAFLKPLADLAGDPAYTRNASRPAVQTSAEAAGGGGEA